MAQSVERHLGKVEVTGSIPVISLLKPLRNQGFFFFHIWIFSHPFCHTTFWGDNMASYVAPELREKFETLSVDLKNIILERNVQLNNIYDLIAVLEDIVNEGEG